MAFKEDLSDAAFGFIPVTIRPNKPRPRGLTIVADRGIGLYAVDDLLASAGEYVDWAKIGIGAYRIQSEAFVRSKVDRYHAAEVKVFFAGDVSELGYQLGQADRFYAAVAALGADGVEVSTAQISLPLADKLNLVGAACKQGLQVIAEAGQKAHAAWAENSSYVVTQVDALKSAGAWKVLIQGEGISEGVDTFRSDIPLALAAHFNLDDLIFQAKDSASQVWYLDTFGRHVNLDVDPEHVVALELMRRGVRKRDLFGLMG